MTAPDGRPEIVRYDQLILAPGAVSRVLPVPGLAERGLGFKSLPDAIELRNRVLWSLEVAESIESAEERRGYLTFVFVGAGYAGLEAIAELQDYVGDVIDRYPRCRLDGTRWLLVEAEGRVMREVAPSLAEFASRELRGRGLEILTGTRLERDRRELRHPHQRRARALPHRLLDRGREARAGRAAPGRAARPAGRIEVDATMRVNGHENVWAVGDAAAVPDPAKKRQQACPPTCQHALRQGRDVAGQRGGGAAGAAAEALPLPHARRVRGHGPPQGGGGDAGRAAARLPGLVRGPHLPHGDDAGRGPPDPPDRRLDGGPVLRPRGGGARPARPRAAARQLHRDPSRRE